VTCIVSFGSAPDEVGESRLVGGDPFELELSELDDEDVCDLLRAVCDLVLGPAWELVLAWRERRDSIWLFVASLINSLEPKSALS
jgi:hypothetical protein